MLLPVAALVVAVLGPPGAVRGAVRTWDGGAGNGLWSDPINWSSNLAPGAGDTALFDGTNTSNVAINANVSVQGVSIAAGYTGTITQNPGFTLTVGTAAFIQAAGTFVGGDSAITVNGAFTQSAGSFTSTSGTLTVTGNFTLSGGTFLPGTGTVAFSTSSATLDVVTMQNLNNVQFVSGTKTIAAGDTIVALGTLSLINGAVNTGTLAAQGNIDVAATFTTASSAALLVNGAGDQTITGNHTVTAGDLPALTINKPSGNLTLSPAGTGILRTTHSWTFTAVPGTFTTAGSTVVFAGGTITGSHALAGVDIRGTVTLAAGTTLTANGPLNLFSGTLNQAAATGTLAAQANVDVQSGFTGGGSATLLLNGSGAQTLTGFHTVTTGALPVVNINKPSGGLTIAGTLRTSANWTYTSAPGGLTVTGSTLSFVGGTITGSHTVNNVEIRGNVTLAAGTTLTAGGSVNLFSGTLSQAAATGTLAAQGNVDAQIGFTGGGSATLLLNGSGSQTLTGFHTVTTGALPVVVINKPSGGLTIAGTLRTGANWTYAAAPGGLTVTGSTLAFAGGTITGTHALNNVEIRGNITLAAGTTVTAAGSVNLFSGTLSQAAATGTLAAQGSVDVQIGFTGGGSGTLLLSGSGNQVLTGFHTATVGALPVVNINKPSGGLTIAGTLRTGANWTYTAAPGGLTVTGSTVSLVGGTVTGSHTLNNVEIRGNVTIAAGTTVTAGGSLNLFSGTLSQAAATGTLAAQGNVDVQIGFTGGGSATVLLNGAGNQTLTGFHTSLVGALPVVQINKPSGALTIAGTLRTGANWTYTAAPGGLTVTGSLVAFVGTQTISGTHTLENVDFRGSGTKTIAVGTTLTVGGLLTLDDGTLTTGTVAAQNNVTQAATFDGGSTTLLFDGTGAQTFTGSATTAAGALPVVVINKPSGTLTLVGTIRTGSNWTWTAGTVDPGSSLVIFAGTQTISGNQSFWDVDFRGTGVKTIAAGTTLTVSNLLTLDDGTLNQAAATGTLEAHGNLIQAATFDGGSATLLINGTGAQTFTGSATTAAGTLPVVNIAKPSGTLSLVGTIRTGSNWTWTSGTVNPGTSLLIFAGTQTITGSQTVWDMDFRGTGVKTIAAGTTIVVSNLLTLDDGTLNTGTVEAHGNVTQAATFDGGSATLLFNGTGSQTLTGSATTVAGDLPNVQIAPGGSLTLVGTVRLSTGSWTYLSGTLNAGTTLVVFDGAVTITGSHALNDVYLIGNGSKTMAAGTTLIVPGTLTLDNGSLDVGTLSATGPVTQLATFDGGSATLRFDGAGTQTFTGSATTTAGDLPNVQFASSGTVSLAGTLRLSTGSWTYTSGTLDAGTSLVVFDSTVTITGSHTLHDVELRGGGSKTVSLADTLAVSGQLTLTDGDLDGGTIAALGDISLLATFDGETGTLRIAGTGDQTLTGFATAGSDAPDIVIDKSSGTLHLLGTIRLTTADWTWVAGAVDPGTSLLILDTGTTISGTHTLHDILLQGGSHTVGAGVPTAAGTLTLDNGTIDGGTLGATGDVIQLSTFDGGTGTLELRGTGPQTFSGSATTTAGYLPDLRIDASGPLSLVGTIRTANDWTYVNGALSPGTSLVVFEAGVTVSGTHTLHDVLLRGGAHSVGAGTPTSGGTLTLENGTIDGGKFGAAGDVVQNATFDGGSGTLELTGIGPKTFTGLATTVAGDLPDVRIDAGGLLTLVGTLRTTHDWTYVGGGVDPGTSLVVLSGTLTVDAGAMSFHDVTVNAGTTSLASDLDVNHDLDLVAGTMSAGTATLFVGGDMTVNGTFNPGTGTVVFDGGTPQVLSGTSPLAFHHLTITNGSGTTTTEDLDVAGTLTLDGPFDISGQTLGIQHAIAGTLANLAANPASSLQITGSGAGIVVPATLVQLANLVLDNPNGAALAGPITIGTQLTLATGVLDAGPSLVVIDPAATVVRTTGHVAGALQKTVPIGIGVNATWEIGDLVDYKPVSFHFDTVIVPGAITVAETAGEHANLAASMIDPSADVNLWWSVVNAGAIFDTVDAAFTWAPTDVDPGAQTDAFVVAKWDGSWVLPAGGAASPTSVTAYNLTSFSEFAIGELQTGDDTDLPDTAQPPMTAISEATLALLSLLIGLVVFLAGIAVVRRMPRLVGR
ncbi:MAG TPA: hypothetical protein VIC63_04710 [Candidatus Limnocylindria bacterium]